MVTVRPPTIRALRDYHGVTGRAAAAALTAADPGRGDEEAVRSWLRRLEQRDEADLDAATADALARLLGVDVGDLTREMVFVWPGEGGDGILSVGGFVVACTDIARARNLRDALALITQAPIGGSPRPMTRTALVDAIGAQIPGWDGDEGIVLDPSEAEWRALVTLDALLSGSLDGDPQLSELIAGVHVFVDLPRLAMREADRLRRMTGLVGPDHPQVAVLRRRLRRLTEFAVKLIAGTAADALDASERQAGAA